jgi:hypothetical protein
MKIFTTVLMLIMLIGSCSVKRKTVVKKEENIREKIESTVETIQKEIRNPATNLLLGDRITRDGEFYQPIDRTIKGSDNKSELRLTVDSKGVVTVGLIVPADTISETRSLTVTDTRRTIKASENTKNEVSANFSVFWILVTAATIIVAIVLTAYKFRLI